jgi:tetratricopeptide (TPR) repeat protein
MRATLLLAISLLLASLPGPAPGATFEEANQLYDRGSFAEAKSAYDSVRADGRTSANLFYNLGNTEFRLNARGRAALNYERALWLDPAHPEARLNLDLLRSQTGARLPQPSWIERVLLPWSHPVYTIVTAVAGWALLGAVYAIVFARGRESFLAWAVALLGALVATYGGLALRFQAQQQSVAIVLEREVTARVAPADRAAAVEPLPAGSRVRVLSERGAWTYCELPGRGRGWLPRGSIETLSPGAPS